MEKIKEGQELEFNVYSNIIKGKFVSINEKGVITIEVISDSSGVSLPTETAKVHKSFLIK